VRTEKEVREDIARTEEHLVGLYAELQCIQNIQKGDRP
jgi:hypothetical protein